MIGRRNRDVTEPPSWDDRSASVYRGPIRGFGNVFRTAEQICSLAVLAGT